MPTEYRSETYRVLATSLSEVLGGTTAKALEKLGLFSVDDLLHHLPRRYLSGTETTDLATLRSGSAVAVVAKVRRVERREGGRMPRLEVWLTDGSADLRATFFGRDRLIDWWQKQLALGVKGIFVGKVSLFNGALQLAHPDFVMLDEAGNIVGRATQEHEAMVRQVRRESLVGIYRSTAKLPTWRIAECVDIVLDAIKDLPDTLPDEVREAEHLLSLSDAYQGVHHPKDETARIRGAARLKFDEALALQLTMAYRRQAAAVGAAPIITTRDDALLAEFDAGLPFQLTAGQRMVGETIRAEMARPHPMQRLLQGEVGSGKTVVALRAMLAAVDAGYQAVLLAPTEVLAGQHAETIRNLLGTAALPEVRRPHPRSLQAMLDEPSLEQALPLEPAERELSPAHSELNTEAVTTAVTATEVVLLTGSLSAVARRNALNAIASGAGLVIGTHALLQSRVEFANLGLIVIDEQHRFGVEQRSLLTSKAKTHPHVLVMTATPIPRSVAMTVFGDLETLTLAELPAERQEVLTTVVNARLHPSWLARAWERVREEVAKGHQVFVVCPRISAKDDDIHDDADETDPDPDWQPSAAVEPFLAELRDTLPGLRLEMLHGRLSADTKAQVMSDFTAGRIDVLVSTTVIEVGVDQPNATMMIVMDADRFGVSQLHQLRGRIGRGAYPGVCLLVTHTDPSSPAAGRLAAVASTRDGFALAEIDLVQRREGDVLGASQSGSHSTLRLLRVIDDADLIGHARSVATRLAAADPERTDPRLADMVASVEARSADEWLERT
ncbi:MAG: ATP-dependent DNA helicase RecG [Propionibacteriaceae bacterium]|jgi:ATP-dependent DNA helicase RecG|nr:ATP-dependent DNA helicase RecG [Propionibacteriaceae bacterium]